MTRRFTITLTAAALLCAAAFTQIIHPPTPRLIYNPTESAAVGWYLVDPKGDINHNEKVAAFAPKEARRLADARGYLPDHLPLIKSVWAVPGDEVCAKDGVVSARNRPDISVQKYDSKTRPMPHWNDCITLKRDEYFLVSEDVQTSWDSRYFGPVQKKDILGTVDYLGQLDFGGWPQGDAAGETDSERQ